MLTRDPRRAPKGLSVLDIDILLVIAIAILQVAMTVCGIYVSDSTRKKIAVVMGVLGLLTVALAAYSAHRSGEVQAGMINGGDSFAFAAFGSPLGPTGDRAHLYFRQHGDYPLHGVHASLIDVDKYNAWSQKRTPKQNRFPGQHDYGPFDLPQNGTDAEEIFDLDKSGRETFQINFVALNGFWIEGLNLRRVNGKWAEAFRISWEDGSPDGKGVNFTLRPVYEYADPDYPRINGKTDWNY